MSVDKADLVREGDIAADYLEALLDIADFDGDIDSDVEGDRATVEIIEAEPGDLSALVGKDGKVLQALQDLARLAVTRETGHRSTLMLDVAGYRAGQRAALTKKASEYIAQVNETAAPVSLPPMSAFERKVIHDAVAAAGLVSGSEGEGAARHIVIRPAD